ncbi:hypothetical protein U9M48_022475 [Paspalum notatum var. saurae]|uniref:F-box/LRR-repeat protein 15/At3g58940/PEG3-like LRR domain-containing protein n=1 Tax=Paspalum notatum var. saurae TaxID=547442 RepID=A0AAQ3TJR9_PASNO
MEQERTPPAAKRARPSPPPQAHVAADAEDRLSALDDGTLHAILARVPLRDAAATAALSRRWPRVFATLPRLVLHPATFNRRGFPDGGDKDYCEDAGRWMSALRRVLDGRTAPVGAFETDVKFMGLYDDWFLGVFRELCGSRGGLLELSIKNTKLTQCFDLPSPVYSCKTLTTLYLYNWRLRVPSRLTGLRAVRSIRLIDVAASDDDIRRFISRCSALEHLDIFNLHKARNIAISAPCLEKLEIYSHRPLRISVKKAPRLETVSLTFSYSYPEDSWRPEDTVDSDEDCSISEVEERFDYEKMAQREQKHTDEIGNMVTFLGGLGSAKKLELVPDSSQVLSMHKVSMPKRLTKKNYLLGLEMLTLALDHNNKVFASLVSCLLNSSPNLKDLRIHDSSYSRNPVPLPAEYWAERINAACDLNHLSSVTFFIDKIFEGHPCGGFCRFLLMNAKVLKKMRIMYYRFHVKPEDATRLEAIRRELHLLPRSSPDVVLELSGLDHY